MSDIFLSYASADREAARTLATTLERHGWSVWWDRRIPTGKDYAEVIEAQLASARCVIVLWSDASAASGWVKTEAADAKDRNLLVPVLIESVKIPLEFRRIQAADLTGWRGEPEHAGFSTLVGDLTTILGAPPAREAAAPDAPHTPPPAPHTTHETPHAQAGATHGAGGVGLPHAAEPRAAEARAGEEPRTHAAAHARKPDATPAPRGVSRLSPSPESVPPEDGSSAGARRRVYLIGGAAALAVAVLVAGIVWSQRPAADGNGNRAAINSATPTPRAPTPSTPPQGNDARRPPVNANPNTERATRLAQLLKQINATSVRDRRVATDALKTEFGSDPQAVEQALALLDESRVGELSPQGLINVLFFFNNTTDAAWTSDSAQRAEKAVAVIEKRQLGRDASAALSEFKGRRAKIVTR